MEDADTQNGGGENKIWKDTGWKWDTIFRRLEKNCRMLVELIEVEQNPNNLEP